MENSAPTTTVTTANKPEEFSKLKLETLFNTKDQAQAKHLIQTLTEDEREEYSQMLYGKLSQTEQQNDALMLKICDMGHIPANELVRERNHRKIQMAIHRLLNKYGQMPNKTQIAEVTGLSRQTIHKHMEEYVNTTSNLAQEYAIMVPQVMNKVLQNALRNNDMRAAKMYLDTTKDLMQQPARPSYVTIDTATISQADIEDMSEDKKKKVLAAIQDS